MESNQAHPALSFSLSPKGLNHLRRAGLRLAFWIPAAPWPILLQIQSEGSFTTGRHSAEALAPIWMQADLACLATSIVGFILLLKCVRAEDEAAIPVWLAFALVNGYTMWDFIGRYSAHYS